MIVVFLKVFPIFANFYLQTSAMAGFNEQQMKLMADLEIEMMSDMYTR